MDHYNFREIEAFVRVVDLDGFTNAAKVMKTSKSGVSRLVSSLEARLDVRLLNRTTRRVVPTEVGLVFYGHVRHTIWDIHEALSQVESMQSIPSGSLRVYVETNFGLSCLSPVMGEFHAKFPDIKVDIKLGNRHAELIADRYDMAIRIGKLEDDNVCVHELTKTTRRMIASPAYFEEYGRPEKIDDLNDHKLLHYSTKVHPAVWKLIASSGEHREVRNEGNFTSNDCQLLLDACIGGVGIAYLPDFLCSNALNQGLVQEVVPGIKQYDRSVYAVYLPGHSTPPNVSAFIGFLEKKFAKKPKAEKAA